MQVKYIFLEDLGSSCCIMFVKGVKCFLLTYLGDLHTPVEEKLGADVVLVLPDVVEKAAIWHQLSDQLHGGGQTDSQKTAHIRAGHPRHHISLLGGRRPQVLRWL